MSRIARKKFGASEVVAITDGATELESELFPNADSDRIGRLLAAAGKSGIETNFNAYLVDHNGRKVLMDCGAGVEFGPVAGNLAEGLKEAGVSTDDIDTIIFTHLHADHTGGAFGSDGAAAFPKAEIVMSKQELAYWRGLEGDEDLDENVAAWLALSKKLLSAYEGRIRTVEAGGGISEGIKFVSLIGHTPGHQGVEFESEGESLVLIGDLVVAQDMQLPEPDIQCNFDVNKEMAAETREGMLEELASSGKLCSGSHFLRPAIGHIERAGSGYRFVSAQ